VYIAFPCYIYLLFHLVRERKAQILLTIPWAVFVLICCRVVAVLKLGHIIPFMVSLSFMQLLKTAEVLLQVRAKQVSYSLFNYCLHFWIPTEVTFISPQQRESRTFFGSQRRQAIVRLAKSTLWFLALVFISRLTIIWPLKNWSLITRSYAMGIMVCLGAMQAFDGILGVSGLVLGSRVQLEDYYKFPFLATSPRDFLEKVEYWIWQIFKTTHLYTLRWESRWRFCTSSSLLMQFSDSHSVNYCVNWRNLCSVGDNIYLLCHVGSNAKNTTR